MTDWDHGFGKRQIGITGLEKHRLAPRVSKKTDWDHGFGKRQIGTTGLEKDRLESRVWKTTEKYGVVYLHRGVSQ